MKFKNKVALAAMLGVSLLATACSTGNKTSSSSSSIPTKITKKTTITFWYSLTGTSKSTLENLTKEFEKKNPNIKVQLQNQGGNLGDLQSKLVSGLQSPKNLPTITQAYPGWLYSAAQNKMLVNLTPYVNNKEIGWGSYSNSKIKSALWDGAKINGTQYGVPFNKSVEVLFYNKTLLDKYGVKVPKTMSELKKASQEIYEKSEHKVKGVGFDSLNNYYMLAMKEKGIDFNKKLNFASSESKAVINYYADGVKDGYFMMAGTEKYMSTPFDSGKVAMFVDSTANEAYVKSGLTQGNEYGIAARPSSINVQQGTDIYMFSKATKLQRTAAFKYLKFLTSKASQTTWANKTGYMPVNTDVLDSASYKASKTSKVPAILEATTKKLYYLPVTKNSESAYDQINANMQTILADAGKKKNWTSDVTTGQSKLTAAWKQ